MTAKTIVIALYALVILAAGVAGMRKTRSFTDFFLGGGNIGPWMTAFTYGTAYFSAVLFIGFAGKIGWGFGYSGIWICLALRKTGGKLITHEIDEGRAKLARENFKRAGVEKYVTLIEGNAHKEITKLKDKIDIVFLDADKAGYVDYLEKLLPLIRPGGLIIAHNTSSHGKWMQPYLKAVTTNKNLETLFLNVKPAGVGVTMKKR